MDQGNMDKNKVPNEQVNEQMNEQSAQNVSQDELSRLISNFDINKFIAMLNRLNKNISAENIVLKKNDTRIDVLNFLKDFLPQDKKIIIDQVIDAFSEKKDLPNDTSPDKEQL